MSKKAKVFKFPSTPGACVDRLKELGDCKKEAQKKVDDVEAEETALENHIIEMMERLETEVVAGKRGKAKLNRVDIPVFEKEGGDEAFYKYVRKNNAFHLLQKRLSRKAIEELWEAGKKVPGITKFIAKKLSLVKA